MHIRGAAAIKRTRLDTHKGVNLSSVTTSSVGREAYRSHGSQCPPRKARNTPVELSQPVLLLVLHRVFMVAKAATAPSCAPGRLLNEVASKLLDVLHQDGVAAYYLSTVGELRVRNRLPILH